MGVIFDSELSIKPLISKTASACFFPPEKVAATVVVTDEVTKQLVTSLVLCRLD